MLLCMIKTLDKGYAVSFYNDNGTDKLMAPDEYATGEFKKRIENKGWDVFKRDRENEATMDVPFWDIYHSAIMYGHAYNRPIRIVQI